MNLAACLLFAAPALLPPEGLRAVATSPSAIELHWTDTNRQERGYAIERSRSAGGPWVEIHRTGRDVEVWTDTGLSPETRYFYRMRAWR